MILERISFPCTFCDLPLRVRWSNGVAWGVCEHCPEAKLRRNGRFWSFWNRLFR